MSNNHPRGRSAAYRLPGIVVLALLGGGGVYAAHRAEEGKHASGSIYQSAPSPKLVQIHSSDSDVEVVPGTGTTVRVGWRADWVGERPSPTIAERNGVLQLRALCTGTLRKFTGLFAFQDPCSIRFRVQLPAGQAIRLTVDSGDVDLRNLRGRIDVRSTSGDINAQSMRGGAEVTLSASSGDVSASFDRAPATLRATASSGDVSVRVPGGHYRISASADSGDRSVHDLTNDTASARSIVVHANSGDVSLGRSN